MKDYQERMVEEYRELKSRYEKLHKMTVKYEAGTLGFEPNCSLELLKKQKRVMGEYLNTLEIRAEIEGIELGAEWEQIQVFEVEGTVIDRFQSTYCPVCHTYHTTPYIYSYNHYDYCPNCGTQMKMKRSE